MRKTYINIRWSVVIAFAISYSCGDSSPDHRSQEDPSTKVQEAQALHSTPHEVFISDYKFESLGINLDTIPFRPIRDAIFANGELEVAPQYEATVTPMMGGNISDILVMEGYRVKKGQVLAYLSHPSFTQLQTDYLTSYAKLEFSKQEFERQSKLFQEEVGAKKSFQKTKSDLDILQAELRGYEAHLSHLNLDPAQIREEKIYDQIPVLSPISGYIENVMVQMGQYVQPETPMISIINIDHIHADLMVFEKDISKVHAGQSITLTVESLPGIDLKGVIFSVGKQFEKNPKAVHVHADILDKNENLIPGMYIRGMIHTSPETVMSLPEEAIIDEEGSPYIFTAHKAGHLDQSGWIFKAVEVKKGIFADGWTEVGLLAPLPPETLVAWNQAYYLMAEMKKSSFEED